MPEREPSILRAAPAGADDEASRSEPGEPRTATGEAGEAADTAAQASSGDKPSELAVPDDSAEPDNAGNDESEQPRRPATSRPGRDTAVVRRGTTHGQGPVFYVAGFWRRLVAAAVDLAIIVPVSLILGWIAGAITGVHLPPSRHRGIDFWLDLLLASDPALLGIVGLAMAVATVYALVFQVVLARTPGMRIMKIRIIDQYGDLLTTGRAAARTAGYLAAVATLGLGFIWIGFDSEKRGLHDWLSGTYVVKA